MTTEGGTVCLESALCSGGGCWLPTPLCSDWLLRSNKQGRGIASWDSNPALAEENRARKESSSLR